MIEKVTQYLVRCDACGKRSGVHHDENAIIAKCLTNGWQGCPVPASPILLFRCPACAKADKYPECWDSQEARGGN